MAGGAGKALRGGGARRRNTSPAAQVKDSRYGRPPHPVRLIPGQVYWPRHSRSRRHTLTIVRIDGDGWVRAKREDGGAATHTLSAARLLSRQEDGQGRFYVFLKWSSRRYQTWALVVAVEDGRASLVLPEWHPGRPVAISQRLLPVGARAPKHWLTVSADLSQPSPARLQVTPIAASDPPVDVPEVCWRPPADDPAKRTKPACGRDCGDIVLEQVESVDQRSFFVRERPAGVRPGSRVYLSRDGEVVAFVVLESSRISPNGLRLECGPQIHHLQRPIPIEAPQRSESWRWRWWPGPEISSHEKGR
jgi:hypothetical protein